MGDDKVYTSDWFSVNIRSLTNLFKEVDAPLMHGLEIGSWEGRSSVWFLENVLTDKDSKLTCIDTWWGGPETDYSSRSDSFIRFVYNLKDHINRVDIRRGKSGDILRTLEQNKYDFIYVDGAHTSYNTLEDAVLSFRLLKVGGFMIFDDYCGGDLEDLESSPHIGVNAFLVVYKGHVEVLYKEYQVFIKKLKDM